MRLKTETLISLITQSLALTGQLCSSQSANTISNVTGTWHGSWWALLLLRMLMQDQAGILSVVFIIAFSTNTPNIGISLEGVLCLCWQGEPVF